MTLRRSVGFALGALSVLWFAPAVAQDENPTTPGAIPDPSTYQGSMELQHQSDQQDQQFREQQSQSNQGYGAAGPSYGGSGQRYGRAPTGPSASTMCFSRLAHLRVLAPLAGKIELSTAGEGPPATLAQSSRPSASDKVLLRRWMAERHHCGLIRDAEYRNKGPRFRMADIRWGWPQTEKMTAALIAGSMTYGEFNYRRRVNNAQYQRFVSP